MASDCGVCIGSSDFDGTVEFENIREVVARKTHTCVECRRVIVPGQRNEYAAGKYDGDFYQQRTCLDCADIRDAFNCDGGYAFGELWHEMRDYGFAQMTTGCLAELSTASGKAYLLERWREWKGLVA